MSLAEDVVVDFFAGGIKYGNAGGQVLGHAVCLYGVATGIISVIEKVQRFRYDFIVGVEEDYHVVLVGRISLHDLLDGIDFGTVVLVGHNNVDRHL